MFSRKTTLVFLGDEELVRLSLGQLNRVIHIVARKI